MNEYKADFHDWYVKHNVTPPTVIQHGIEDDILSKLQPLKAKSWRLEGNRLIAETDLGPVINFLPTDVIMTGIDSNNLPILAKINQ